MPQRIAAARAGMSERTARKYEHEGKLPSQLKRPHDWNTRQNLFEEDWPFVVEQLERDSALQGSILFALVGPVKPGRNEQRVRQRYLRMDKETLVDRLITGERTSAEERERWLSQQDDALTWRLRAEAAEARLKE